MNEVAARLHQLSTADDIVVYCRTGARSAQATKFLQSIGYEKVRNLRGGVNAYAEEVDPSSLSINSVFLVTGISAAGKSTVSQKLAERFDRAVHVKGDVFRRMVVTGRGDIQNRPDPEARRQLDLRYRLGAATADAYFDAGFDVVAQDIIMGPSLTTYVETIRSRPLHVVVLVPRTDVVALREQERPKTAYRPDGPTIVDLDTYLRSETPKIGLWLDTSEMTPEQTVDEILARRAEALV